VKNALAPVYATGFRIAMMVIITIMAGFTKLRFGMFGLSELCTAILFIEICVKNNTGNIYKMIFTQFWLLTIMLNCAGLLINVLLTKDNVCMQSGSVLLDILAYLYMMLLCFTLESVLIRMSYNEIINLFKKIYKYSIIIVASLFVISRFKQALFGLELLYKGVRFSPLSDNPHQINILTSTLPIISFKFFKEAKTLRSKISTALYMIIVILLCIFTMSDTMKVVYIVSIYLMILIRNNDNRKKRPKYTAVILATIIGIAIILYAKETIVAIIIKFFQEGDSGGARFLLWYNSIKAGIHSPIFGLGPGAHTGFYGPFEGVESHQLLLAMFTQTGIIGVIILIAYMYKIIRTVSKDKYVFIMTVGLFISGLSGTTLRRTIWWIYLMICYYLTRNSRNNAKKERNTIANSMDPMCEYQTALEEKA
jgi:hypothetical protein